MRLLTRVAHGEFEGANTNKRAHDEFEGADLDKRALGEFEEALVSSNRLMRSSCFSSF